MAGGHPGHRLRSAGASAALALVLGLAGCSGTHEGPGSSVAGEERVERVIDGDTVELSASGRARLIGVDTPEVHGEVECFGREASAFTKRALTGRVVEAERGADARDRYGRLLVYLYVDGEMFNEELIRRGYAQPLSVPPNVKHEDTFEALASAARETEAGLWGVCP